MRDIAMQTHSPVAVGSPAERSLHIVLHDVAPPTRAAFCRVLDALSEVGSFPVTLLAVPRYNGATRDSAFERWLVGRAEHGDEVALHGYTHRDEGRAHGPVDWLMRRFYTRSEGEFRDLRDGEVTRRLDAGLAWLRDLSIEPSGFIAPAWLMGPAGWRAMLSYPFDYTCTLRRIHLLNERRSVVCQAQVFSNSAAWRRTMSTVWNSSLASRQREAAIVRLELHPADADFANVRHCWQQLAREQSRDRVVSTLAALVARVGPAPSTQPSAALRTATEPIRP
jgi:predicted deacetylase